ncbi:uncharacterized protein LOC126586777 isoform X3 [Malus sylvestris]|uniref:uncharacterized protein LOC126586777 isoform X3 n=1 Tax=Malus sylvestris TaxID=3752 RepID=UPI0021AC3CDC|nr:uncharacterized protein LOC126586777 isoform X3 [Malus sylvestris]
MSVMRPELVMKSTVPVVMVGLLGGMKVEADKDESSTYAVMLASDVPQRWETRCIIFCMDTTTCTLWMQCDLFFLLKLPLLILSLLGFIPSISCSCFVWWGRVGIHSI